MSEREHTGRILDGRFELLERLGSGGMGTVWRALDLGLQREVAIKEVRPADADQVESNPAMAAQLRERVLRESRALARLQHPNVVSIYQIVDLPGSTYPWIVMELVRGTSLEDRLAQGVLSPVEAAGIGRDVLAALRSAHAAGVMHRDVKPGNVLLRPDGSAVLTDFGIAALQGSTQLTATGEVIGSPEYIAPERLRGDETQVSSDFWSLAMLLYVAVEGNHPMRRASTMATLAAVMTEPVPPPRRAGALGAALNAALLQDPAMRPSGEALDQLFAAAERETVGGFGSPATPAGGLYGPPTPAGGTPGPNYAATPPGGFSSGSPSGPHSGPHSGPQQQWRPDPSSAPQHGYQPGYPTPLPAPRKRTGAVVFSLIGVVLVIALTVVVVKMVGSGSGSGADAGSGKRTGAPGTSVAGNPANTPYPTGSESTPTPKADLLTPDGARTAVAAFVEVMGTSKVSDLTLWPQRATAVAPTTAVPNGFDNFEYAVGGKATKERPDGVDADRAVLDLNEVNWDALPALIDRATKELGVPAPTSRYVIIDTGLIDHKATIRVYLADDYGGAYLSANLKGEVERLYPRDK
ncbi:serine/threonine protein kinase [Actinosynnema pretiosum subsp. pretiosum]|uniref:non-specific serine/threonine protein kinase n=1 Tax=Actinosynnema pretiosum subsp. pretiosum TaxID=103721 RepID=A0AA45L7B0_9PSEU|nr:serine/threonine protein kinase [Actinosynnema pretiosum subsp. pretiosum]QUF04168.1 serine/threonine protein kinase [Actinosynnema pretiosum subsp. pretiosum]